MSILNLNKLSLAFAICLISLATQAQSPFGFEGKEVLPGTRAHFSVSIADGEQETVLPITVFHGTKDGPVLGLTAGVHGYEYSPILAGQQLIGKIDPQSLTGTVILVQIANVGSFQGRSPFVNPLDNKNLNRTFPGSSSGTITERIAHYISEEVIARSDYFVDMHSGDASEDLMSYSGYYHHDNYPEISRKGRALAASMGFDHVLVFQTTNSDYMKAGSPSLYCSAEAFKRGIPAADIECGRLGMVEEEYVEKISNAVLRMLGHLEMSGNRPRETPSIFFVDNRTSISSEHTGFFYPMKSAGSYVKKGMKIGHITNYFNRVVEEIVAPESGIILYMVGTPPINKGETLVSMGIIQTQ